MPVTPIIAPELFDRLIEYTTGVERDKVTSSEPTDFCDNFYGQFFQNRMNHPVSGFGNADKELEIKFRLKVEEKEPPEIVLLLTWFETYCDIRYNVFVEEYGGGSGDALSAFQDYLDVLLERIAGWAKLEQLADIEGEAVKTRLALQQALQTVVKK
jgi:hypothetical protein